MIPKYHEKSQEVEIHERSHGECTPEHQADLEPGWECTCTDCKCEFIATVQAAYDFVDSHGVILRVNGGFAVLPPNVARALASALSFAANDADQLNKDFPTD